MNPKRHQKIKEVAAQRQLDLAVMLENVQDPHNIAAILRTCDAVGVQSVYAIYSDPATRPKKIVLGKYTSKGTRKWVDVYLYEDPLKCVAEVKQKYGRILATAITPEANNLYTTGLSKPTAILFGNEHSGVSEALLKHCDGAIMIPQMGMAQSLNISVACAVVLYECLRQRQAANLYNNNRTGTPDQLKDLYKDFVNRHESEHKGRLPRVVGDS